MSTVHEAHVLRLRSVATEIEIEADYYARQIAAPDTTPTLPDVVEEETPELARAKAHLAVVHAVADVLTAVSRLEAVAVAAAAYALDKA